MKDYLDILSTAGTGTFILVGDRQEIGSSIRANLKSTHDVIVYSEKSFDIDSAREITKEHTNKSKKNRCFVISFFSISVPAQNALLKLLEEPSSGTIFCIVTSDAQKLLPTVWSRAQTIEVPTSTTEYTKKIQDLLRVEPWLRLETSFLKKTVALKDNNEKVDRESIALFIESLVNCARSFEEQKPALEQRKNIETFSKIISLYSYAHLGGSSLKNIAEFSALTLPKYDI